MASNADINSISTAGTSTTPMSTNDLKNKWVVNMGTMGEGVNDTKFGREVVVAIPL